MQRIRVKIKVNQLLSRYDGNRGRKFADLARDLHIKPRWLTYLASGEKKASYHLAMAIDQLLAGYEK